MPQFVIQPNTNFTTFAEVLRDDIVARSSFSTYVTYTVLGPDGRPCILAFEGNNLEGSNALLHRIALFEQGSMPGGVGDIVASVTLPGDTTVNVGTLSTFAKGGEASLRPLLDGRDVYFFYNSVSSRVYGHAGDDALFSGAGDDTLVGGSGADELYGEAGFDFASYEDATSGVIANLLDRSLNTGDATGDNYGLIEGLIGSNYADRLTGDTVNNALYGGSGDDTLAGGRGNDTLDGGVGNDTAVFSGSAAQYTIVASNGAYVVTDSVASRDGVDTVRDIRFAQFADQTTVLFNNTPSALALSQVQFAENAPVSVALATVSGTDGDGDALSYAVASTDGPFALVGNALVLTGPLDYESRTQYGVQITATDAFGATITQSFILGVLNVLESEPTVRTITPGSGALIGEDGNDRLTGSGTNDVVLGGAGNDVVYGKGGRDLLTGGAGRDVFIFDTKPNKKTNIDKVTDFNVKDDAIYLENAIFKALGKKGSTKKPAQIKKAEFALGGKTTDQDDHVIYNKKTGALFYDADGTGSQAQIQIATLSKNLKMTYKDFFVI
jgi:Ca2+-binding RTX toxin-like protein